MIYKSPKWLSAAALAVSLMATTACGSGGASGSSGDSTIDLVAYSTPESAYKEISADFAKTPEGKGVKFSASYGGSGDQSRAVEAGQPADFVNFSLESDVTRLVDAGLVAEDWQDNKNEGIVADSLVVIVTRPGNPLDIQGWDDIVKPGVEIVTPNPGSSGGARWNVMAAWGHALEASGGDEEAATEFLTKFFQN